MAVRIKPGKTSEGQSITTEKPKKSNIDYTFTVPEGAIVEIIYENK